MRAASIALRSARPQLLKPQYVLHAQRSLQLLPRVLEVDVNGSSWSCGAGMNGIMSHSFSTAADLEIERAQNLVLEPIGVDKASTGLEGQRPLDEFQLSPQTMMNLQRAGISHLFPVQAQSFDVMMDGKDIVGRSKTGSGKTLAFALPIIEKVLAKPRRGKHPVALVLLPTRELAQQVSDEIARVAPQLRTAYIVGGVSYIPQQRDLRRGVDIVVGTPGRIMDLVEKNALSLDAVEVSVLDEADMMLKFGFQDAVETILGWVPDERQCVLWSATFPKWVSAMAKKYLRNPVSIDLVGTNDNHVPVTVAHKAIHAPSHRRIDMLENVLRHHAGDGQTLVFTETKQEADEIANVLGGNVRALHGDLSQGMRSSTMEGFRKGSIRTLVCTDIAARGLDIANVDLVVQFRLPSDKESFVHRAGRTGRAGRSGTNIVFFDRKDVSDVKDFERRYKFQFQHAAPPQVEHLLESSVDEIASRLESVPSEASRMFEAHAVKLYEEKGISFLSSALALLAGFDEKKVNSVSMITGKHSTQTVELAGISSIREARQILADFFGSRRQFEVFPLDGKFIFDIPHDSIDRLRSCLQSAGHGDVTVSPAMELSRLIVESPQRRESRGDRGGRFRQHSPNRWEKSDFDAPFSRGRDRERRSSRGDERRSSRKQMFGRFGEDKQPRRRHR